MEKTRSPKNGSKNESKYKYYSKNHVEENSVIPKPKPSYIVRKCLRCDNEFVADSPYNRMCQRCVGIAKDHSDGYR